MMGTVHTQQCKNVIVIFYYIDLASVFKGFTIAYLWDPQDFGDLIALILVSKFQKFYILPEN